MENKLFSKVSCSSYLKKVSDGNFIEVKEGDAFYNFGNSGRIIKSECCGDLDFIKTYYELKTKDFEGFVVGFKSVTVAGFLVASTDYHYDGIEYVTIDKEPSETVNIAIVYYGNNRKRFVPVDDIEYIEDEANE